MKKLNEKYEVQLHEQLLAELRMIRRLLDKAGRFETEREKQVESVGEIKR